MNFRMVAPPEVEAEGERLYDTWEKLPCGKRGKWEDYRDAHCSKSAKAYMRKCAAIHAHLEPGERV